MACKYIEDSEYYSMIFNQLYDSGLSITRISELFGCDIKWPSLYIDRSKRRFHLQDNNKNHLAFSNKDSMEANYWSGILMADGCISNNSKNKYLISFSNNDLDVMLKFKSFVTSENKINKYKRDNNYQFRITSKFIQNDLINNWNFKERKSLAADPPEGLSDIVIPSFVRGMFDGDGHVSMFKKEYKYKIKNPSSISFICTASLNIAEWLLDSIPYNFRFDKGTLHESKLNRVYRIVSTKYEDTMSFLNWIYKDSTQETRMNRKYEIYKKLLQHDYNAIMFGRDKW